MFSHLRGQFSEKSPAKVVIDIQGVGYDVNISLNTYTDIQSLAEGKLFTVLIVKEDSHTLYGFSQVAERDMFLLLIGISGVGSSTARMMLSCMRPHEIVSAIASQNSQELERIKGIGKKTAERIVLELKDKVTRMQNTSIILPQSGNTLSREALEALLALGINRSMGEAAIKKSLAAQTEEPTLEGLVKLALRNL